MYKLVIFLHNSSKPLIYHINENIHKIARQIRRIMKADNDSLVEIWISKHEVVFLYKKDIKVCAIHYIDEKKSMEN